MKKTCLLICLLSITLYGFAQHEQHNMPAKNTAQQRNARRIGPVVEYNLYVKDTVVNFTGKKRKALAINGQIPAPTLRFTEGDSAVVHVHNLLNEEVSIHWHGVLLPNPEDGVPVLNTPPIHAGQTHTFRFRIIQNGTLWYHSHSGFQEQEGLYGPLVFYPAVQENESGKKEEVLQITDWRDERGSSIMRSLKRRNEWYAIKKKGVQSWGEAIVKGHFGDKVQMEWTRMPGADVSDVYYQKHLMHGQPVRTFEKYKKGDSVLLRVINGSAATYYWLQYSGGKMKVIGTDGNDVTPVEVDKLLIATAETYDIMIRIPDNGQYEFRATAQDITGSTSAFFGTGPQVKAKDIPPLDYMVLMNEMNKMTWMMKGMGMKMKMGLYMKMDMENMNMGGMQGGMQGDMPGMNHGNMQNMNMTDSSMNNMPMDHSKMDSSMNMSDTAKKNNNMNMTDSSMNNMPMDHSKMDSSMNMNMGDTAKKSNNMQNMDHSNMPGMQKTTTKKTTTPAKKPAPKNTKAPVKKPAAKKPAPRKKDPMQGMDHGKMKMGHLPEKSTRFNPGLATSLYGVSSPAFNAVLTNVQTQDTVPDKNKTMPGHNMGNMKMDTVPKKQNAPANQKMNMPANMENMQHGNMNTGGIKGNNNMGGMQMNTMPPQDTSRSYMLQTMMPKTPMTGFDFPPGNGNDVVLSYNMLRSDTMTALPKNRPWREIEITLSGNMQRYVWSVNGKTLSEQDMKFMIRKGENVRVVFTNATMMEHPMHLHGHFFRVINNQGANAPMKHTFNINAMATQVIEFAATEEKDWFLHCHTIYHMVGGMATIFSYEGTESEVQKAYPGEFKKFKKEHGSLLFPWVNAAAHTQGTFGTMVLSGGNFQLDQDWRSDYKKNYDFETRFQYFLDKRQFFSVFAGAQFERNDKRHGKISPLVENQRVATMGLIYTFPFFINAEARVDHRGRFRFQLRREDIPITTRTRLDFYWNTDREFGLATRYIIAKYLALSANYDFQYGFGVGLAIIY